MRHPLVERPRGTSARSTADPPAAMRYTEIHPNMARIAGELAGRSG